MWKIFSVDNDKKYSLSVAKMLLSTQFNQQLSVIPYSLYLQHNFILIKEVSFMKLKNDTPNKKSFLRGLAFNSWMRKK